MYKNQFHNNNIAFQKSVVFTTDLLGSWNQTSSILVLFQNGNPIEKKVFFDKINLDSGIINLEHDYTYRILPEYINEVS